jgi:hypothetical protein
MLICCSLAVPNYRSIVDRVKRIKPGDVAMDRLRRDFHRRGSVEDYNL